MVGNVHLQESINENLLKYDNTYTENKIIQLDKLFIEKKKQFVFKWKRELYQKNLVYAKKSQILLKMKSIIILRI